MRLDGASARYHVLQRELQLSRSWKNVYMMKDNLMVNDNVVCKTEVAVRENNTLVGRTDTTVFAGFCMAHSMALTLKPVAQRLSGLTSCVVRIGHIHQSARGSDIYEKSLLHEIDSPQFPFEFHVVAERPR